MIKLISASLLGALIPIFFTSPVSAQELSGEFRYLGNDDVTVREHHYSYDDSYFDQKPQESSYELLKCSMCMALAASRSEYVTAFMDKLGFKYTNDVDEIRDNLNVLAGSKITDSIYYPAQSIDGVDYYNSIAYGIGKKEVGDTTLIMVAIRGSDYGIEWGGDFDIGNGENHEGFEIAADQVLTGLEDFIGREKITGKKKVWISGYSRGAATANLVAARLDDGAIKELGTDNVYAFCFECPRTTRSKSAFDKKYQNIVCVANPDDIVPKVAMGVWGYRRFGRTYHMPAYQSDADYPAKLAIKEVQEREILGKELNTAKDIEYQLNEFVEDLAVVTGSPEEYVRNYQEGLIHIAMSLFGHPGSKITPDEFLSVKRLEEGLGAINMQNTREIFSLLSLAEDFRLHGESPLLNVHNMENSLAWIDSVSAYSGFGPNSTTHLYLNNVEDMEAFNASGNTVLSIKDRKVQPVDGGLFSRVSESGQIVVVFPQNTTYTFRITKSSEKYVLLSLCDFDMVLGYPSLVADYDNIVLDEGMVIAGALTGTDLKLTKGSKVYKPQKVYRGDEVSLIRITGGAESGGIVTGGGIYTAGQRVALGAVPEPGYTFDGWYLDDKKISDQALLIVKAEGDVNYRALFKK